MKKVISLLLALIMIFTTASAYSMIMIIYLLLMHRFTMLLA